MTRDQRQEQAIQKLSLDVHKHGKACFLAEPGFGKTRTAIKIFKRLIDKNSNVKILVIVPLDNIRNQWKLRVSYPNVTIDTWQSLYNKPLDYDYLIIDELHMFVNTEEYSKIFITLNNAKWIGLTGTLDKHHMEGMQKWEIPISDVVTREECEKYGWINNRIEYNVAIQMEKKDSKNLLIFDNKIRSNLLFLDPRIEDDKEAFDNPFIYDSMSILANYDGGNKKQRNKYEKVVGYKTKQGGVIYLGSNDTLKEFREIHSDVIDTWGKTSKQHTPGSPKEVRRNFLVDQMIKKRGVNEGEIRRRIATVRKLEVERAKLLNSYNKKIDLFQYVLDIHPQSSIITFSMTKEMSEILASKYGGAYYHSGITSKKRKKEIIEAFNSGAIKILHGIESISTGGDYDLPRVAVHFGYKSKSYLKRQKDARVTRERPNLEGDSYIYNFFLKHHPTVKNGEGTREESFLKLNQKNTSGEIIWITENKLREIAQKLSQ